MNTMLYTLYDKNVKLMYTLNSWLQLWDAVEGSLRCVNEDGVSGITALAFLNNR